MSKYSVLYVVLTKQAFFVGILESAPISSGIKGIVSRDTVNIF